MSPKRERQLVQQVQRGDRGALGELLGAYHKQVYHLCLRMVSHAEDAADLAQEVLLKAISHIDDFSGRSRFSTWLFRIAMNLSISHLRKRKVRAAGSLDAPSAGSPDGDPVPLGAVIASERELSPDRRVEEDEQIARLLDAVGRLEEPLKAVILLRDLQLMDYQQIAEVLGVPVGTVKSRLFRARLALRSELGIAHPDGAPADLDNEHA